MAHPLELGGILARRAAKQAGLPKIRKQNRRAAQDRKFGAVSGALPSSVQVVADWQLYRQKQIYAPEVVLNVGVGQKAKFLWNVPVDRAWYAR